MVHFEFTVYFILFKKMFERELVGKEQRERERESQAGSMLSAHSLMRASNSRTP